MSINKKTLVFIICPGRSGSTVYSKFLGTNSNCFALSEIHYFDTHCIPERFPIDEMHLCSCERNYSQCDFWSRILQQLEGKGIDLQKFNTSKIPFAGRSKIVKFIKYLNLYFYFKFGFPYVFNAYFSQIKREAFLLEIISSNIKEQVIVDSSKSVIRAIFLHRYLKEKFDIKYLYITREPLGNIYSNIKNTHSVNLKDGVQISRYKETPNFEEAVRHFVKVSNNILNLFKIFRLKPKTIIYEEFASDPEKSFSQVSKHINLSWELGMDRLDSKIQHLVGGNLSRISGKVIYPPKLEWKKFSEEEQNFINIQTSKIMSKIKSIS